MEKNEMTYVGIDFSKEKFNACLMSADGAVMGECELPNSKSGCLKLMRWTKKMSGLGKSFNPSDVLYCGEHTGMYSIGLADYLHGKGLKVWLENALMIKYGSGFQRGKSDKADAETIALYARNFYRPDKTLLYEPASAELRVLRSLFSFHQRIVKERVALGNIMQSRAMDASTTVMADIRRRHGQDREDESRIKKEMTRLMAESRSLCENYAILTSFPGIGPINAAAFLIFTGNFTLFTDPRKFACHCGVAPFSRESGTSVHSRPRVSHFAQHLVKAILTEAAKSAIIHNPVIRDYADRLRAKGKHEGIVLNNVKDKIIHIVFKMIATKTHWNPDHKNGKTTGVQSQKHLGDADNQAEREEGAAAVAVTPSADTTVQSSPSALGGMQNYQKSVNCSKLPELSFEKTCTET